MLAYGRVHGDLSAYNILYWRGDHPDRLPQAISPQENRNAYRVFERDLTRVCEYFARQGAARPARLAGKLWSAHKYRRAPEVDPAPAGRRRQAGSPVMAEAAAEER
jgi:serine/threonine-protein kinase RIO1